MNNANEDIPTEKIRQIIQAHPFIHIAIFSFPEIVEENVDYFILITHFKPQFITNKSGRNKFRYLFRAVNTLSFASAFP